MTCGGCGGGDSMDRRVFLSRTALAAVSLALAACAAGDATGPSLGGNSSNSIKVSDYPQLANVDGVAMFTINNNPLAVVRTGASSFVALSRICPHQGGLIGQASFGFMCPVHGAEFNITGQWIGGQRTSNMRSYTTSYDAATGTLTIG